MFSEAPRYLPCMKVSIVSCLLSFAGTAKYDLLQILLIAAGLVRSNKLDSVHQDWVVVVVVFSLLPTLDELFHSCWAANYAIKRDIVKGKREK